MKKVNANLETVNRILQISIFLLVLLTVYVRFYKNHYELPKGCDEFGYLHMADAIQEGKLLNEHTERPFIEDLTRYLSEKGYNQKEYSWIIAPHAYHLDEGSNKIINQYPIGTSSLMAAFPKAQRQFLFPVIVVFLIYALTLLVSFKQDKDIRGKQFTLTSLFILISIISAPFLTEYINVNSVAPTFGLLLAAGICMKRNWRLAAFLIALTVNFRLANVLLFAPLFIYQLTNFLGSKDFKTLFRSVFETSLILLLVGILPYMLYTKLLLNEFLASTYSSIDQAPASIDMLLTNLKYYFIDENKWFIVNTLCLGLMYVVNGRKNAKLFISFVVSLVLVYLFFVFHAAKTPYYPYGIALLLLGVIIQKTSRTLTLTPSIRTFLSGATIVVLLIVLFSNGSKFQNLQKLPQNKETSKLQNCFEGYDVVWGELKTGTIEYATATPSMRFNWGSKTVRDDIMMWLKNNGYKQVIFLNDLELNENELQRLKNKFNLSVNENHFVNCGLLLEL